MSNLREKARAVKAAGEAERGNFNPTGAPKRMYDYWLDRTDSKRGVDIRLGLRKENFCHFWRVVAIWGPLMWLGKAINRNMNKIALVLGLAATIAFVIALFTVADFWVMVLGIIGVAIVIGLLTGGFIAGISSTMTRSERIRNNWMVEKKTIAFFGVVGFPGFIVGYLLLWIVRGAAAVVVEPVRNHPKAAAITGLTLLLAAAFGASFLIEGLMGMAVFALVLAGAVAVVALGIFVAMVLSDYVSGKRALAEQQRELYYETHGEYPKPPVREPSALDRKMSGFFRGLGDFIVLIAQVVRVNKWKICPTVEIDTASN